MRYFVAMPSGEHEEHALAVHRTDSDVERLLEAARDDSPVLRITIPHRRNRRARTVAVATALGLLVGALVAWWLLTR